MEYNSELNQIKEAIDQLLNVSSNIRRKKRNKEDRERDVFITVIHTLQSLEGKNVLLFSDHGIDMSSFTEPFMEIIDALLILKYGKECYDIISFFLWERVSPEGDIQPLVNTNGEEIILEDAMDLWNLMLRVNPSINKK